MIKLKEISAYSVFLLSGISRCYLDKNISDEEMKHNIDMNFKVFYNVLNSGNSIIDFKNLTVQDALDLGFFPYTEADNKVKKGHHVMLVPLYLIPALPEGIKLYCVDSDEYIEYNGIDSININYRSHFTGYGVVVKNKRISSKIKSFSKIKKISILVNILGLISSLVGVATLLASGEIKTLMWAASCSVLWLTILFDSLSN